MARVSVLLDIDHYLKATLMSYKGLNYYDTNLVALKKAQPSNFLRVDLFNEHLESVEKVNMLTVGDDVEIGSHWVETSATEGIDGATGPLSATSTFIEAHFPPVP